MAWRLLRHRLQAVTCEHLLRYLLQDICQIARELTVEYSLEFKSAKTFDYIPIARPAAWPYRSALQHVKAKIALA